MNFATLQLAKLTIFGVILCKNQVGLRFGIAQASLALRYSLCSWNCYCSEKIKQAYLFLSLNCNFQLAPTLLSWSWATLRHSSSELGSALSLHQLCRLCKLLVWKWLFSSVQVAWGLLGGRELIMILTMDIIG